MKTFIIAHGALSGNNGGILESSDLPPVCLTCSGRRLVLGNLVSKAKNHAVQRDESPTIRLQRTNLSFQLFSETAASVTDPLSSSLFHQRNICLWSSGECLLRYINCQAFSPKFHPDQSDSGADLMVLNTFF